MSNNRKSNLLKTLNSLRKYRDMQARFNELYSVERIRLDDVYDRLAAEFYMQPSSITRALSADVTQIAQLEALINAENGTQDIA